MIKDLGVGNGSFLKVDCPVELIDNHLINIGDTYILINLIFWDKRVDYLKDENTEEDLTFPILRIKVFGGPSTGNVAYFDP